MPQLVEDVARADIHLRYNPGELTAMTSFYFRAVEPNVWSQPMLNQMLNIAYSFYEDHLRLVMSSAWLATRVEVRDIGAAGGLSAESLGPFTQGALVGGLLPSLAAMKVDLRTTPGGLPQRGGMFLPVGTEAELEGNLWTTAFQSAVAGHVQWLSDQASADPDFEWVVVSRVLNGVPRPAGIARPVQSFALRRLLATQRGRLRN